MDKEEEDHLASSAAQTDGIDKPLIEHKSNQFEETPHVDDHSSSAPQEAVAAKEQTAVTPVTNEEKTEPELRKDAPLSPGDESKKPGKAGETESPTTDKKLKKNETDEQNQIKKHKDVISELENAVKREVNARKELEDMLMRMERHLRTEEEARKSSESQLDVSLQNEVRLKKDLDTVLHQQKIQEAELQQRALKTESERQELEELRHQLDTEIVAARDEAHKAVEDLKTVEDRVRASERAEMSKMETEYQKRISMLGLELERVRQELIIRTKLLSEEMERWRQQAEITSAAVIEAKAEVTERKRDLDSTRDKMDKLMDRLHIGREHGLVLQASLTAANAYTSQAQRTLIQSMESSFQSNVQQTLPWGGQVGVHQAPLITEGLTDPMTLLNRGIDIAGGKAPNKPRMIETNKSAKQKTSRTARRGRP